MGGRGKGEAGARRPVGVGKGKVGRVVPLIPRRDLLARFREMVQRGIPIVGGGAGTGLSAKCEEAGGIDLIVIYNSGRYRMAGRGSAAGEVDGLGAPLLAIPGAGSKVSELDLAEVPPRLHPLDMVNVLDDDEPRPSLPLTDVLANAPDPEGSAFGVPSV